MAQEHPLMPHATASWLVDNTSLTFEQVAEFCGLHILEVQAIADETAGSKYTGRDPVRAHEVTMEEIEKGQEDAEYRLVMSQGPEQVRRTKGPRYTPVSKRADKPDGIAWLIKNHPEVTDGAIGKLIGTTRNTINAIRDRSHWNIANIVAKDPVTLGLCSQRELDALVAKAAKKAGIESVSDTRFAGDKEALLVELKAERETNTRLAAEALAAEQAAADAEARGEAPPAPDVLAEAFRKQNEAERRAPQLPVGVEDPFKKA